MHTEPRVIVVGGGVSGLTAAHQLVQAGCSVTVLEAAPRVGGKLAASDVAGVPVDSGAESLLVRRPEGLELVEQLGLSAELTHPATVSARIYSRGRLRRFPEGHMMGIPGDPAALARSGVLSPAGAARAARDLVWPRTLVHDDVPVAAYIGVRMGREVVDRLVEPMLGGVYAGRADRLSLDATLPQLASAARTERSLAAAVRGLRRPAADVGNEPAPVFATLRGGIARLIDALREKCGAAIETGTTVRGLRRVAGQWQLEVGSADRPRRLMADGVIVAAPAPAAARLLEPEVPEAARRLAAIEYASMAIVTMAYRRSAFQRPPDISGFLVPAVEGRALKAVTFSSTKWPWLAEALDRERPPGGEGTVVLRCSIGRIGEEEALHASDDELAALAARELADMVGVRERPLEHRVTRWGGALPQYAVGHGERIAAVRAAVRTRPKLAVCGAAYEGVGIPACVSSARTAVRQLTEQLMPSETKGSQR